MHYNMAIQQATIWYILTDIIQLEPYLANGGPKFTTTVETLATGYVNILPSYVYTSSVYLPVLKPKDELLIQAACGTSFRSNAWCI